MIIAQTPAGAQGIRTERPPPFDFSAGCVTLTVTLCDDEVPAIAALAYADHRSGLVSARGVAVGDTGPRSEALVGIGLVLPRGAIADLEALVEVADFVGAEACLVAGSLESCARPAPGEKLKLALRALAPADATLVADPSVVLRAPGRSASTPAAASAFVRLFAYTLS